MKNNQNIIQDILHGDGSLALDYLYENTLKQVRKYILHHGGSKEDADDIFQDGAIIFLQLVRNQKFDIQKDIAPYVMVVCKNLWIAKKRLESKRHIYVGIENKELLDNDDNYIDMVVAKEKAQVMHQLFSLLGENCRKLLVYFNIENKSMKDICQLMGHNNEDVTKTQHYRCKKYFIKILEEHKDALDFLKS